MKKAYIFLTITAISIALLLGFWIGRNFYGEKTVIHISTEINSSFPAGGKLDINTATAQELEALPGIGSVLAGRIAEYRNTHGPFTDISQVLNIEGVSQNLFARIKDQICIDNAGEKTGNQ